MQQIANRRCTMFAICCIFDSTQQKRLLAAFLKHVSWWMVLQDRFASVFCCYKTGKIPYFPACWGDSFSLLTGLQSIPKVVTMATGTQKLNRINPILHLPRSEKKWSQISAGMFDLNFPLQGWRNFGFKKWLWDGFGASKGRSEYALEGLESLVS